MEMLFVLASLACSLVGLVCNIIVLVDAFKKDTTTGFLCLCIPCYILYYMFTSFEHPQKSLIIAGAIGGGVMANVFSAMGGGFNQVR